MNKTWAWVIGIIVVILIIWGIVVAGQNDNGQATEDTGPIKIGMVLPLTGDLATLGENALAAAKIAAEEINTAGGVSGRDIELIVEDGQCAGKPATSAANKLINADNVVAIAGGFCSTETSAFTQLAEQSQTPMISPCSSAPPITNAGDYVFRVYPSDSFQGVYGAEYLKEELGIERVAVLYSNDDWGNGLKGSFTESFTGLGGEVVVTESFEKTSRDLRTQLSKIKATDVGAVYFPGYTEASIAGIQQMQELGMSDWVVLGADAWADPAIWEQVGDAGEGFRYTEVSAPDNEEFALKLQETGNEPTLCAPHTYDVVKILASVIADVSTDGEDIKEALYNVSHEGLSSPTISFDENGDLVGAQYAVRVIRNGEQVVAN